MIITEFHIWDAKRKLLSERLLLLNFPKLHAWRNLVNQNLLLPYYNRMIILIPNMLNFQGNSHI